jgi:putative membrane protein
MWGIGHMGGFGFGFGWFFELALWALIIWAIVSIFRRGSVSAGCCGNNDYAKHESKEENAVDILNKRYAKGEIGKEEYERIKKEIQ